MCSNIGTSKTISSRYHVKTLYPYMGMDERCNNTSESDIEVLRRVEEHYEKFKLLKYLEKNTISISDKVKAIEKSNIYDFHSTFLPNINSGGLFDDWLYEIT